MFSETLSHLLHLHLFTYGYAMVVHYHFYMHKFMYVRQVHVCKYVPPTSKAAPAAKPSMPTPGMPSWTPTNPPIFGPSAGRRLGTDDEPEVEITYLNLDVLKGPLKFKVEPGSERPRSHLERMADHVGGIKTLSLRNE